MGFRLSLARNAVQLNALRTGTAPVSAPLWRSRYHGLSGSVPSRPIRVVAMFLRLLMGRLSCTKAARLRDRRASSLRPDEDRSPAESDLSATLLQPDQMRRATATSAPRPTYRRTPSVAPSWNRGPPCKATGCSHPDHRVDRCQGKFHPEGDR